MKGRKRLAHLYAYGALGAPHRLQDACKTWSLRSGSKVVILMGRTATSIVLSKALSTKSELFMIAQHSVDASQIHQRQKRRFLFPIPGGAESRVLLSFAAFDE